MLVVIRKVYYLIDLVLFSLWNISLFDNEENSSFFSDEKIIEKIKKWDEELFEEILERYWDKMFRYTYYQFNLSKERAEEIVQEIFLKVWNNIDKFDTNTNFNAWIYRLAHNLILDTFKKKEVNLIEKDIQEINLSAEQEENKDFLLEALLWKLEETKKELLILYYFEWKSYEEIAEIYDTNKNTVGSWISRIKKSLKEIVENDEKLKEALLLDL